MPQPKKYASHAQRQAAYRLRQEQARRKQLSARGLPAAPLISTMPGSARWNASLQMAYNLMERTIAEMQDYYDDRSEGWQESERGDEHQERIASIEAVLDALTDLTA
jgi:hypothetical protein